MPKYPVKSVTLALPSLNEVATALRTTLTKYFEEVEVEVVECPDLTKEPFQLVSSGLGGETAILDIGGPPFLLPHYDKTKLYNMKDIIQIIGIKPCFLMGAGAGPWPHVGKNCEMIANLYMDDDIKQNTYIAKVDDETSKVILEMLPSSQMFALLANLFACQGITSEVLKIACKKRITSENYISAIRLSLEQAFPTKTIGLGGTFLLKEGTARQHVMPNFSDEPLNSDEDLNNWLKFYDMSAPLVAVGTLISKDVPDFDLRVQHFHSFSNKNGEGGHYHYDITPNEVEYLGYFNLGKNLYRIDQPQKKGTFGKD